MIPDFDALVLGGGLDGCASAAIAARNGMRVVLAENSGSLGGLATNGLYSYFPAREESSPLSAEVELFRAELLAGLGFDPDVGKAGGPILYKEQKLKIVLAEILTGLGVRVLSHVFVSEPIIEEGLLHGFVLRGKTGGINLRASWVIDASGCARTSSSLGLGTTDTRKPVFLAIKMNGVDFRALTTSWMERGRGIPGQILGSLDASFAWSDHGISVSAKELRLLGFLDDRELIVHGLEAEPGSIDPFALSSLQMTLRQGAYKLLDHLRKKVPGFTDARIIHVAPKMDITGLRVPAGASPYANLVFCGAGSAYENDRALGEGILAAKKLTSAWQGGII